MYCIWKGGIFEPGATLVDMYYAIFLPSKYKASFVALGVMPFVHTVIMLLPIIFTVFYLPVIHNELLVTMWCAQQSVLHSVIYSECKHLHEVCMSSYCHHH